jgi:hypothetical protein
VKPSWVGWLRTNEDSLILAEALLQGRILHVPRRIQDRERLELIKSGHVYIYEENGSGIKRWTDGYHWSPSRIQGSFLIYREVIEPAPQAGGGAKRRTVKNKSSGGVSKPSSAGRSNSIAHPSMMYAMIGGTPCLTYEDAMVDDRALWGSLIDSYDFKPNGLMKKTITIITNNDTKHHIVSYYDPAAILNGTLTTPSKDPQLKDIYPRASLYSQPAFKDAVIPTRLPGGTLPYGMMPSYPSQRSQSLPYLNTDQGQYMMHSQTGMQQPMPPYYVQQNMPRYAQPGQQSHYQGHAAHGQNLSQQYGVGGAPVPSRMQQHQIDYQSAYNAGGGQTNAGGPATPSHVNPPHIDYSGYSSAGQPSGNEQEDHLSEVEQQLHMSGQAAFRARQLSTSTPNVSGHPSSHMVSPTDPLPINSQASQLYSNSWPSWDPSQNVHHSSSPTGPSNPNSFHPLASSVYGSVQVKGEAHENGGAEQHVPVSPDSQQAYNHYAVAGVDGLAPNETAHGLFSNFGADGLQ